MGKRNRDGLYASSASGVSDDDNEQTSNAAPNEDDDQDAQASQSAPDDEDAKAEKKAIPAHHANHHEHGQPHIALNHYLAQHQTKPDQLAGFKHHALREHKGKHTIADWDKLLSEFNQRPIR